MLADALKLLWVESACFADSGAEKYLVFGDAAAARHFKGKPWAARALDRPGFRIRSYPFDEQLRRRLLAAQRRQGEKFAGRQG